VHLIRTLPALQHDEHDPEDLDTSQEDHACFASGTVVDGLGKIEDVGFLTKEVAKCVRLTFSDGRNIVCTPDHLFLTEGGKWIKAESLQCRRLSSAIPFKNSLVFDIISAAIIFSARAIDFIAQFGNLITGQYQRVFTFITLTATREITSQKTLKYLASKLTSAENTAKKAGKEVEQPLTRPEKLQSYGTEATKVGYGIKNTGKNLSGEWWIKVSQKLARFAGRLLRLALSLRVARGSAIKTVERVRCVRVDRLKEPRSVYCMATKDGTISIQGGIVVSNCDALRYGLMARPIVRDEHKKPTGPKPGTVEHMMAMSDESDLVSKYRSIRPR
jgi:hypothetical protein